MAVPSPQAKSSNGVTRAARVVLVLAILAFSGSPSHSRAIVRNSGTRRLRVPPHPASLKVTPGLRFQEKTSTSDSKRPVLSVDPRVKTELVEQGESWEEVLDILAQLRKYDRVNALVISKALRTLARLFQPPLLEAATWDWLKMKAMNLDVDSRFFDEQCITDLFWSVAQLHEKDASLLDIVPGVVQKSMRVFSKRTFKAPQVVEILESITTLTESRAKHSELYGEMLPVLWAIAQQKAKFLSPEHIASILSSAAALQDESLWPAKELPTRKLPPTEPAVMTMLPWLAKELVSRRMPATALARSLWGLSQCHFVAEEVDPLVEAAVKSLQSSGDERWAVLPMMVAALVKLRLPPAELLKEASQAGEEDIAKMDDWSLCVLAWAVNETGGNAILERVSAEIHRRGLEPLVDRSPLGPKDWRRER